MKCCAWETWKFPPLLHTSRILITVRLLMEIMRSPVNGTAVMTRAGPVSPWAVGTKGAELLGILAKPKRLSVLKGFPGQHRARRNPPGHPHPAPSAQGSPAWSAEPGAPPAETSAGPGLQPDSPWLFLRIEGTSHHPAPPTAQHLPPCLPFSSMTNPATTPNPSLGSPGDVHSPGSLRVCLAAVPLGLTPLSHGCFLQSFG